MLNTISIYLYYTYTIRYTGFYDYVNKFDWICNNIRQKVANYGSFICSGNARHIDGGWSFIEFDKAEYH